jgi:hypothetical protein
VPQVLTGHAEPGTIHAHRLVEREEKEREERWPSRKGTER